MKKQRIEFQIDQLRKDKIIYATEAGAINLACLLVYYFSFSNLSGFARTIFEISSLEAAISINYF